MHSVNTEMWWFGTLGVLAVPFGLLGALCDIFKLLLWGGGLLLASVGIGKSWLFLLERSRQSLVSAARHEAVELPETAGPIRLPTYWLSR